MHVMRAIPDILPPFLVHWSDWSSQPEVRIACTKKYHLPWRVRKDLPEGVYEIPNRDGDDSILYAFEPRLVTCQECMALESFHTELEAREKYEGETHEEH